MHMSRFGIFLLWRRIAAGARLIAVFALAIAPMVAQAQGTAHRNDNAALSGALTRLNRNPRDAEALIAAGNAALATGDTDAAIGFFTRANSVSPDNPRVEAGLAGAKVRAEDPFSAIPLFIAAEKSGPIAPELLSDRGLAYDLIGDNANAQQYYRQALAATADAPGVANAGAVTSASSEVSRRLALSLAIAGDRRGSDTVLSPLLQKQDRAAWRTRIFALAILGYEEEAVATAKSTMPPNLALQLAPYLRYMRRLTPAQQAAAANLGHFPQAAAIGQDDPRVAQYARALDRSRLVGAQSGADRNLVPAGAPLGSAANDRSAAETARAKRRKDKHADTDGPALAASDAAARAGREPPGNAPPPSDLLVSRETRPATASELANAPPPPIALVSPAMPQPATPSRSVMGPPAPAPTGAIAPVASPVVQPALASIVPPPAPQLSATAAPRPHVHENSARPSFSDAFSAMSPVVVDITPERGAVDLRKISPKRAVAKAALPPPPSHPSRIWVELGVGRDTERIAFDWRRMVKDDPEIFKGRRPFVSSWARTNRLLVGPFETDKAANAFTDRLHKADHPSAFVWTSPAGQVVDPLDEQ